MQRTIVATFLVALLFVPAMAAGGRGTVEGPIVLKGTPHAVVAVFSMSGPAVRRLDVVSLTRKGRAVGKATVIATWENRAVLAPTGTAQPQAGDEFAVISQATPRDWKMPEVPWAGGFPAPDLSIEGTHQQTALAQPTLPLSNIGYEARWIEWTGQAAIRNVGKDTLHGVTVDVYVNGAWALHKDLGDLPAGASKTFTWTQVDAGLQNVPSAAAPSATIVVLWKGGRGLRARSH